MAISTAAIGALAFTFVLTGCNTMAGAGKDIERGGEKIESAALKANLARRKAQARERARQPPAHPEPEVEGR